MLLANSAFIELLQSLDRDVLGAVFIVGTVLFFVTVITSVVTICKTLSNLAAIKSNRTMVEDLLSKGYSVDDVERLVYGQGGFDKLSRVLNRSIRSGVNRIKKRQSRTSPPVKASA